MLSSYGPQFSQASPNLQVRVNATSLTAYKTCPQKYALEILGPFGKPESDPNLAFGTLFHAAVAIYHRNVASGAGHTLALQGAFRYALHTTWNPSLRKPTLISDPVKNRAGLLRSLVWYLDKYEGSSYETLILPSGAPAIELQFEFDSSVRSLEGQEVSYVGTLDRIVRHVGTGKVYGLDVKTSTSSRWLTPENFSPGTQFSLYCLALRTCFGVEAEGFILDGVEVGPVGTKFNRIVVPKPPAALDEWYEEQRWWLGAMARSAAEGRWPQNDTACGLYGGCRHRARCAASPQEREMRK